MSEVMELEKLTTGTTKLPKGWKIAKLGNISSVSAGNSAPQNKDFFKQGNYPFIRTSDVGKIKIGSIESSTDYLNEIGIQKLRLFKKGTILFPKSGASTFLNHRVIMDIDGYVSSHLATIKAADSLLDRFLWYFLTLIDARDLMQDIAYPSLKLTDIKSILVPFPPLSEQQRIVEVLDQAFAAIAQAKANAEQNQRNAKELFDNSLQILFGNSSWEKKSLGEVAEFKNGMNFTKSSKGEKIEIVGVKNFQDNFWVPINELDEVTIDGTLNDLYKLKEGDIITVRSNGNPQLIGRTLLIGTIQKKVTHSGFTIRIRLKSNALLPKFLCHYLKTKKARKELVESGNGVGIKSLNQGSLSSLKIPFPQKLQEQQQIVEKLNQLSTQTQQLEAIYQQKLDDLEELKKSILYKAFNGEL